MKRQIDIDLLLPKIAKLKLNNSTEKKVLTLDQVLWILEHECALQNSTVDAINLKTSNTSSLYIPMMDRFYQEWARSANVVDCQDELFRIKECKN